MFEKNYLVTGTMECSPEFESCFVWDCLIGEDAGCDRTPYVWIEAKANSIPSCLYENDCERFECSESNGCYKTYCSDETKEEYEICIGNSNQNADE